MAIEIAVPIPAAMTVATLLVIIRSSGRKYPAKVGNRKKRSQRRTLNTVSRVGQSHRLKHAAGRCR
jgi:hypothetical protein